MDKDNSLQFTSRPNYKWKPLKPMPSHFTHVLSELDNICQISCYILWKKVLEFFALFGREILEVGLKYSSAASKNEVRQFKLAIWRRL